jgi:uncharacterized protein YndB with AHSA1/START domain
MDIDIERLLGAVSHEVSTREHEGRTARVANASRVYDTNVADLWNALTNRERIPRWFLPVTGDLRLGGQYQIEGNASGTITECDPPNRLGATWEYGDQVSWITVTLSPADGGRAHLALEHVAYVDDELWSQFGPGAVGLGWDLALMGLELHLATGEPVDPEAGQAWPLSDEGKRFVTAASEDWARASIAAGTPAEEAMAAAERATAFYTVVPDDSEDDEGGAGPQG